MRLIGADAPKARIDEPGWDISKILIVLAFLILPASCAALSLLASVVK